MCIYIFDYYLEYIFWNIKNKIYFYHIKIKYQLSVKIILNTLNSLQKCHEKKKQLKLQKMLSLIVRRKIFINENF